MPTEDPNARNALEFKGLGQGTGGPDSIVFDFDQERPVTVMTLVLSDSARAKGKDYALMYKVKTTNPKKYRVTNRQGFLSQSGKAAISLTIKIVEGVGAPEPGAKPDQFMVQYACYERGYQHLQEFLANGDGDEKTLIQETFGKGKKKFEYRKFRVRALAAGESMPEGSVPIAADPTQTPSSSSAAASRTVAASQSGPAFPILTVLVALIILGSFGAGYVTESIPDVDKHMFLSYWLPASIAAMIAAVGIDFMSGACATKKKRD